MLRILEFWGYASSWGIWCYLHPPPVSPVTLSMECWEHRQVRNVFASEVAALTSSSLFAHQNNQQEKRLATNLQNVTPVSLWQPTVKLALYSSAHALGPAYPGSCSCAGSLGAVQRVTWLRAAYDILYITWSIQFAVMPSLQKKTSSWHWPACEVLLHNQCSK